MDNDICIVIFISDGVGDELCLLGLGLVMDLHCKDTIISKSLELTHFNKGQQASLVFHPDKMTELIKV